MTMAPRPPYMRLPSPLRVWSMPFWALGQCTLRMAILVGLRPCPSIFFDGVYPEIVCLASVTASWYWITLKADESVYGSCPSIYSGKT